MIIRKCGSSVNVLFNHLTMKFGRLAFDPKLSQRVERQFQTADSQVSRRFGEYIQYIVIGLRRKSPTTHFKVAVKKILLAFHQVFCLPRSGFKPRIQPNIPLITYINTASPLFFDNYCAEELVSGQQPLYWSR